MTIDFNTLSHDDIIDTRDIIERIEELEETREALREEFDAMPENAGIDFDRWVCDMTGSAWSREEQNELDALTAIMEDLKGNGGDEQWRGDWYPVTLIRESYFREYCLDLCHDIGSIPRDLPDYIEIDWEATARNLRVDYTYTEIDGVNYLYR